MKRLSVYAFWINLILMGYVYFIYPGCISLLSRILDKKFTKGSFQPPVSIIITAYNEERNIARKIENTLTLDYPHEMIEIIVGSDGSTDQTDEIVRRYEAEGVRLVAFKENHGKTYVQNECVLKARNEIIIFMDAASLCKVDAIQRLVENFADERIGAVAGRVEFVQSINNLTTQSQNMYWRYEQHIKKAESRFGSLVGVDGPLYAIKRNSYVTLQPDIISDLITPLLVIRDGLSVIYEPKAVTYEEATRSTRDEQRTRERIITRGLTGLFRYPELFDIISRPMLAWQIVSHKVLRWLAGFYFFIMFVSTIFLITHMVFFVVFCMFVLFFGLAYQGFRSQDKPKNLYVIPYYFVLVNWAAMRGIFNFILGRKIVTWKPVRD